MATARKKFAFYLAVSIAACSVLLTGCSGGGSFSVPAGVVSATPPMKPNSELMATPTPAPASKSSAGSTSVPAGTLASPGPNHH